MNPLDLVQAFVRAQGPPGAEGPVRQVVADAISSLGLTAEADAKGNLLVPLSPDAASAPRVVVTAHLDEIALIVTRMSEDGALRVAPLGGVHPWKWGEQPVDILGSAGPVKGILSFGSVHTDSPESVARQARTGPLQWEQAHLFTGKSKAELLRQGVLPGSRVVLGEERRELIDLGTHVAGPFLDDRADLAAWALALKDLLQSPVSGSVLFVATAAEEVGGEGAAFLFQRCQPEVCVALEIGPSTPECRFYPDDQPTVWVNDSYAPIHPADQSLLVETARELGMEPHWQALSRGGSDASCAASRGLVARPVTLGFAVENSHGLEIMHKDAVENLARLTTGYLRRFFSAA